MLRIGTPTMEAKNGWLKKEMDIDFHQDNYKTIEDYMQSFMITIVIDQVMHYNIKPQLSIELNWGSIKFFLTVYFSLTSFDFLPFFSLINFLFCEKHCSL